MRRETPCRTTPGGLARAGLALRRHRGLLLGVQWAVVLFYAVVVALPAFLPLPGEGDRILNHLTRFAQFLFWGVWWPFVILSVMALGRVWCGVFCPEGALSEFASRWSLDRPIPAWLKWGGWPFVAFLLTTAYGQMVSVYEYPRPALLILGGSTLVAIAVGLRYGRGRRVWCRHLCPVSGVFGLLARIAPVHFAVDRAAWDAAPSHGAPVRCAPLIDIRRMQSASACHMCGQCAGQRGAVALAGRRPGAEIVPGAAPDPWGARLLVYGMLGAALGAFQWSASPWFIAAKQGLAVGLLERDIAWPLETPGQWWLFTHYPEVNDAFTWLDGGLLLAYLAATALVAGGWIRLCLGLAARTAGRGWVRLAPALIPYAGASVFVGLSLLTTGQLSGEGVTLPWAHPARLALLALAALWSARLAWRLGRAPAALAALAAAALPGWLWWQQFYVW
ncbi:MAG: 4Fe-4S binding protein [Betaproteobacteria bacterium]|nr:4Fe-4S binding protein [Betaproteobacteria bacterium]